MESLADKHACWDLIGFDETYIHVSMYHAIRCSCTPMYIKFMKFIIVFQKLSQDATCNM